VAGLDTASPRELRISAMRFSTCHIPSLSKFIRVVRIFFAAKFTISGSFLMTFLLSRPGSIDDPPTKVVTINAPFVAHLGTGCLLIPSRAHLTDHRLEIMNGGVNSSKNSATRRSFDCTADYYSSDVFGVAD
jgi:hypothetical protein